MEMSLYAAALLLAAAAGQSVPARSHSPDGRIWTVATGLEKFSIRDVARSGIPIETSPVAVDGNAWFLAVRHERRNLERLHAMEVSFIRSTGAGLATPLQRLPAPDDGVVRLDARYEYRRSFGRNRLARGLEFSAGPVGLAAWQKLDRSLPPNNAVAVSDVEGGGGGMVAARLTRWRRITFDGGWTIALMIGRTDHAIAQAAVNSDKQGGGGWRLEDHVSGSIRLSERVLLAAAYRRAGQVRFASHRGQSDRWNRFEVGVTYVH